MQKPRNFIQRKNDQILRQHKRIHSPDTFDSFRWFQQPNQKQRLPSLIIFPLICHLQGIALDGFESPGKALIQRTNQSAFRRNSKELVNYNVKKWFLNSQ